MNEKENIGILILCAIVFLIIFVIAGIDSLSQIERDCDKYRTEYKLNTVLTGNIWDGQICYVVSKEGIMIDYEDVNFAQVYDFTK